MNHCPRLLTTLQTLDCGESLEAGPIDDEPNLVPNGKIPRNSAIAWLSYNYLELTVAHAQAEQAPKQDATECTIIKFCERPLVTINGAERAGTYVVDEAATDVLEQNTNEMGSLVLGCSKTESFIPAIIFHDRRVVNWVQLQ